MLEVTKLKNLLGTVSDEKDTVLQFILDDVEETILNYCNIDELPEGLVNTAYRMAMDIYRNENIGSEEGSSGDITSIKEGDTTVNFGNSSNNVIFANSILKNYIVQCIVVGFLKLDLSLNFNMTIHKCVYFRSLLLHFIKN